MEVNDALSMAQGLTFIIGAPRSGTTWLAKVFDSHPKVVYRHEPDLVVTNHHIPLICPEEEFERYLLPMRDYVGRLIATRSLKSLGSLPVFAKAHDNRLTHAARVSVIVGMRLLQKGMSRSRARRLQVPSFAAHPAAPAPHIVIKSIDALGRAGLLAEAMPEARIILLMRNPFGQIASRRVGVALGKFSPFVFPPPLLRTAQAARLSLTHEVIRRSSEIELMAWEWAILNEKAYEELAEHPRVRILRYSDMVEAPQVHARELFAFAGLPWHDACESFIRRSTSYRGPDLYFQVFKDASRPLNKWRTTLTTEEQQKVAAVVCKTNVGRLWPDLFS